MTLARGNALALPLASGSVDLIVTSPPYFGMRSYTDGGEHYDGQLGSEATPADFIAALVEVTRECVRVLKPSGSLWVNLGDKYAGSGGHNNAGLGDQPSPPPHAWDQAKADRRPLSTRRSAPDRYNQASDGIRAKSLMGLPWRYALACIDDLGLILRAEVIWSKPNGLPESVTDRVRRSHEQFFHMTKEPRYFSAVDEIREASDTGDRVMYQRSRGKGKGLPLRGPSDLDDRMQANNPLGKLPGSVWTVPTEPLRVPDHLGVDHFAAFPSEWPKRIILGWSPSGVCVECGEGRRPVVDRKPAPRDLAGHRAPTRYAGTETDHGRNDGDRKFDGPNFNRWRAANPETVTGYACACATPDAPTRPAIVLDPFAGTGTTVAVANALGRHGIGLDLSADYLKLARWRCQDPGLRAKVLGVDKPKPEVVGQLDLLGGAA